MQSTKATIDEIAGYLGIGFLQILGIFLILDGLTGFLAFIEVYSKTNSWTLFVSISLLAMAYLLGIMSSNILSVLFTKHSIVEKAILDAVCEKDKSILYDLFSDYRRNMRFMRGSTVGAILLAIGALCEANSGFMGQWSVIGYLGAVMGLAFLPLANFTMNKMSRSMVLMVDAKL